MSLSLSLSLSLPLSLPMKVIGETIRGIFLREVAESFGGNAKGIRLREFDAPRRRV